GGVGTDLRRDCRGGESRTLPGRRIRTNHVRDVGGGLGIVFSVRLNDAVVGPHRNGRPGWGFTDAAGSSLGEITFLRTYSRKKEDGSKEKWYEVCERVINGMYSIQKDYAKANRLPWSDSKAQASAQEAFVRLFEF